MGIVKILVQGKEVVLDSEDLPLINGYKWCLHGGAYGTSYVKGHKRGVPSAYMHRLIMGVSRDRTKFVDHINSDGLDNRRQNLRLCSQQENLWNKRWCRMSKASSKYKGVVVVGKPFRATITVDYKPVFLGAYATEREAAIAYNNAAIKYFGKFARLNNVD